MGWSVWRNYAVFVFALLVSLLFSENRKKSAKEACKEVQHFNSLHLPYNGGTLAATGNVLDS